MYQDNRKILEPLISIIIPVYNSQDYLERCLESVFTQDYQRFEVLLIDDGSEDRSGVICDEWSKRDNRFTVYHTNNRGQSSARNLGLDQSRGGYITFIDSDDYISRDYLSYLISLFAPDCQIVECNHCIIRGNTKKPNSKAGDRILSKSEAFEEVLFSGCIDVAPWGKLYRRSVFDTLRFPDGRIFEDTWIFGEVLNQTEKVAFGSRCCYFYVIHAQSTVRKNFSLKNIQYIEASQKLAADAIKAVHGLDTGCIRRINHAKLSVLRYMEHCDRDYTELRSSLRNQILKDAPLYINDARTPKRDRIAVLLLKLGFVPFYYGWKAYSLLR